jgi:large subunit ribosomal protein L10
MVEKEKSKVKARVSQEKKNALAKLLGLINKSRTVMIVSIENVSSAELQKAKQSLKQVATLTIIKKSLANRCLEQIKKDKPNIAGLEKWLERPFAILSSDLDAFELASMLAEKRFPARAKAGQIAPSDIVVEAGATDLMAGPAISELGAVGLKTGIEQGKIAIKERKVLVPKGEVISSAVASVLMKLEVVPFMIGIDPLVAYEPNGDKTYENIRIDKAAALNALKGCASEAFTFSIHLNYPTAETISFLIIKANQEINALSGLIK